MKTKKVLGMIILLSMLMTLVPTALACGEGYSPGYWKGRCRKYLRGQWPGWELDVLIDLIPGYEEWTVEMFLEAFGGNNKDGHKTMLANLFNAAAGLDDYVE